MNNLKKIPIQKKLIFLFVFVSLISGMVGGLVTVFISSHFESDNSRIKSYYEDENAVLVSPTILKRRIDAHDKSYILVDLRSKSEFDKEHILTAVNIPAVSLTKEQVIKEFSLLPKDKEIIVHCYSMSCMLGRQTGKLLSEHGIFVKELGIGWSEWRYFWSLWNPGADETDSKKYIFVAKDSTESKSDNLPIAPCQDGELGC